MIKDLPIRIRECQPEDKNFILDSWHRSDKGGGHWSAINQAEYMRTVKKSYERILDTSQVLVACLEDVDWQIFGYCVAQPADEILWWLFVKSAYRKLGIGEALLLASVPEFFTGSDITSGCHTVRMARYVSGIESRHDSSGSIRYNPQHIMKTMR